MYRNFYLILFILLSQFAFSQIGEWTWLKGDSTTNGNGYYGIQGISSPLNTPRALYEACEWTDLNGNFWLFGGTHISYDSYNDLWKYDPNLNEWTWMKGANSLNSLGVFGTQGVSSPNNFPPALGLGMLNWTDLIGNLWFFGGSRQGTGVFCDLWRYNISSNEWTWMKGPGIPNQSGVYGTMGIPDINNFPGSRNETAAAWTDSNGDLWLFGGQQSAGQFYNDVWKYNVATNIWTFMKGSIFTNQSGYYVLKGVEDALNTPSARWIHCRWKDSAGNFWIYSGGGNNALSSDLWRFNPNTNNWTFINGDTTNMSPNYGLRCIASAFNSPGSRFENRASWVDTNGNLLMFGGGVNNGLSNDLWMYNIASDKWKWISGNNTLNPTGLWGVKGISSSITKPSWRLGSNGWKNQNNELYLFGGLNGSGGKFNDLWKYSIDTTCILVNSIESHLSNTILCDISPNPASEEITISFNKMFNEEIRISIYNSFGSTMFSSSDYFNTNSKKLNVSYLPDGFYIVRIQFKSITFIKRIIKD